MRASRKCKRQLLLPTFIHTHLQTRTNTPRAASWFRELILYCYEHRQLANLPHLTPTQSLSCFCQQWVGEHGTAACLLTVRKPSKTHTHTHTHTRCTNTTLSLFTHSACWSSYMHRATVQTAIKLTSACVCPQQLVIVGATRLRGPDMCVERVSVQSVRFSYVQEILYVIFKAGQ